MSLQTIVIIFLIVLAGFFGVIFFQFRGQIPGGQMMDQTKKLSTTKVTINNTSFTAEVARVETDRQRGLSGRKSLGQEQGMLFTFDQPGVYSFWMKDVQFPLDIIFIKDDKIVSFAEKAQPATDENPPLYYPGEPIDTVLEINAGLVEKHGFKKGDKVKIEK